jgi:hypothetical protein
LVDPLAAGATSPNPSDPGTESNPRLDLVPEPGIGMAAAGSDDPRTTEAN